MRIRDARPEEADFLSALAIRSKAYWGYDEAFLAACRAELTFAPEDIVSRRTAVAEEEDRVVGFVTLLGKPPQGEIGALFVEPDRIGRGVGRALWEEVLRRARREGFTGIVIDADPGAEAFYERMGARRSGRSPSGSIPGRFLPRLVASIGA